MNKGFIWWSITVVIMLAIFQLSSQPKDQSNALSMKVTEAIVKGYSFNQHNGYDRSVIWNNYIRKFAHFFLFLLLAISFFMALRHQSSNMNTFLIWAITLIFCIFYAVSDEVHQIFVPGRGCQIKDIFIDFSGSVLGSLLAFCAVRLFSRTAKPKILAKD